jgi:uncharacterized protein with PIN domain
VRFIADEMLGKLSRWLRMAGFDVLYLRQIDDAELLKIAQQESQFLLTRDTRLIRRCDPEKSLFIGQDHLADQLRELFGRFPELKSQARPLSRCVECNALLLPIAKEEVREKVWPYVYQSQEHFTTCPDCHRIYWEATHVAKIRKKLESLIQL